MPNPWKGPSSNSYFSFLSFCLQRLIIKPGNKPLYKNFGTRLTLQLKSRFQQLFFCFKNILLTWKFITQSFITNLVCYTDKWYYGNI